MNGFEKILYALQGEMERPKGFGWFHLLSLFITLLFIISFIKNKSYTEKRLKRILLIYGLGAFILELLKQIVWSFNYENGIVSWSYEWYAAPFQLCSTPIYVSLICFFLKKGKLRDNLLSYMAFVTILGSLSTAIYPDGCFVRTILINIHTMYLHLGSFAVSIYLLVSKEVKINKKSFINGYLVFLAFAAFANLLNIIIYHSGVLHGETFNMFYISPYFNSVLPVFEIIQPKVPYLIFLALYFISILIGSYLIYLIAKLTERISKKKS